MPTTYAHYRLGTEVRKKVSPEAEKRIEEHLELFYYGVHGPDLLFYYNALSRNPVNEEGYRLHRLPGEYFFDRAAALLREGTEDRDLEASYVYLYGFLCHFALDVCCHGYIQERIEASGITHSEIEAELDRELLVKDGKDPVRQKLTGHLKPSREGARVISRFFEGVGEEQIYKAMKDMVRYLDLLVLPGRTKRGIAMGLLKISGHYESKRGLIINYEKNPACEETTAELIKRYQKAAELAAEWIDGFPAVVRGEAELPEVFRYDFGSRLPGTEEVYGTERQG